MSNVIPFDFDDDTVRVVMIDTVPWWVANDIAKVLGYRDASRMTRMLDEDEKGTHIVSTVGGDQTLTVISESGLFAAILKSRREEAQRFRRWVTGEVLPALRRSGRYDMPGAPPAAPAVEHYDSAMLSSCVATVRTAMRLFGNESARNIWIRLGLPAPIAQSSHGDPDELAQLVAAFLADRQDATIEEVGVGIGMDQIDHSARIRIGSILRLLGWHPHKARRGRGTVNLFTPAATAQTVEQ